MKRVGSARHLRPRRVAMAAVQSENAASAPARENAPTSSVSVMVNVRAQNCDCSSHFVLKALNPGREAYSKVQLTSGDES